MRKKVTVVGAGNVGANCAVRIADKELADVVLVDVVEGVPQGKGLDLLQSGPVQGYDVNITGANDYAPTANSDIAIITAGFPRKPGMSRDDLLLANFEVIKAATAGVVQYSPDCIIIVVTNPLDAMAQAAFLVSKFSKSRVVGRLSGSDQRRMVGASAGVLLGKSLHLSGEVYLAMQSRGFRGSRSPPPSRSRGTRSGSR